MLEKDFNTIWNNMFKSIGFSYKIPDPQKNQFGTISDSKRPFDIFSCAFGRNWYVENKLVKGGYYSFNFNRIEDHQWNNLQKIHNDNKNNITVFGIGFYEKRKIFDFIVLDLELAKYLKESQGSIKRKELLTLKENDMMITIKKKSFDINLILEKILTIQKWKILFEGDG